MSALGAQRGDLAETGSISSEAPEEGPGADWCLPKVDRVSAHVCAPGESRPFSIRTSLPRDHHCSDLCHQRLVPLVVNFGCMASHCVYFGVWLSLLSFVRASPRWFPCASGVHSPSFCAVFSCTDRPIPLRSPVDGCFVCSARDHWEERCV